MLPPFTFQEANGSTLCTHQTMTLWVRMAIAKKDCTSLHLCCPALLMSACPWCSWVESFSCLLCVQRPSSNKHLDSTHITGCIRRSKHLTCKTIKVKIIIADYIHYIIIVYYIHYVFKRSIWHEDLFETLLQDIMLGTECIIKVELFPVLSKCQFPVVSQCNE